jgi:hypothetical protein
LYNITEQTPSLPERSRTLLWLWWTLATTFGGLVSIWLLRTFVVSIIRYLNLNISALIILVGVFAIVGVIQWLVLRLYITDIVLWLPATAISGLVGWLLFLSRFVTTPQQFGQALFSSVAVAQLFLGVPQSALLYSRLQKGILWIGINVLGWMLSNPVTQILAPLGDYATVIGGWGTWGAVTGIYLTSLLHREPENIAEVHE